MIKNQRLQRRNSQNLPEEEKEKQTLRVKAAKERVLGDVATRLVTILSTKVATALVQFEVYLLQSDLLRIHIPPLLLFDRIVLLLLH